MLLQQKMAVLPPFRTQECCIPFQSVAVDFFGNLKVKLTRNISTKTTVLIITCTTTRVIHLEMCLTEDTEAFLRAWRRFCAGRGIHPSFVFADCGTNFSAGDPIKDWIESWDELLIKEALAQNGTSFEWKRNTMNPLNV